MTALGAPRPIPLADLHVDNDWNTRSKANLLSPGASEVDPESAGLDGLLSDLLVAGQTTPVDVRTTTPPFYARTTAPYSLVCGFRRYEAVRRINEDAKLKEECHKRQRTLIPNLPDGTILAQSHGPLDEKAAFLLNAGENGNREGLTPPEIAALVKRGIEEHGLSVGLLAVRLGKDVKVVGNYARLGRLPKTVFEHWTRGGEFEGKPAQKRVGVVDMIVIARLATEDAQLDAYRGALRTVTAREATSAWHERARGRSASAGQLLARLERSGLVSVLVRSPRDWLALVDSLIRHGKNGVTLRDASVFAEAARAGYERERAKIDANGVGSEEEDDGIAEPQSLA